MTKHTKKRGINIKDIYIGQVVLIKEYNEFEKIPSNATILSETSSKKITSINVRKIAFAKQGEFGVELAGRLNKNKFAYKVVEPMSIENNEVDVKNNTLVISKPKKVGSLLRVVGFPSVVKKGDEAKIRKMLLSSDKKLNIRNHSLKLSYDNIFNISQYNEANEQASKLFEFKLNKLTTKPQEIEKVYKKHFK